MNWCILIPALVGIISAILGYLLGKLLGGNNSDLDEWKRKNAKLENDLAACKSKLSMSGNGGTHAASTSSSVASSFAAAPTADTTETSSSLSNSDASDVSNALESSSNTGAAAAAGVAFNADAAKAAFGKKIKQDDLTVVEGIGPKIQELFHNHDVKTWGALSECTIEKCQKVLDSGGARYQMHNPGTWPTQAKMAFEGLWAELKKWQDEHDGGRA